MEVSSVRHAVTTLFILLQFATYMDSCLAAMPIPTKTNTEYIKKSCGITLYPQLCYKSLSSYAKEIQTSPKLLASTALSVSLSATRSSLEIMKNLSTSPELKPREATAMRDCVELLGDSVDELQRSMEEMGHSGGSNVEFQVSDIQTWVSAALTNADTCTDGFAGKAMNGNVKTVVRRNIPKVAHLTSNALALINNYAGTPPQLK